MLKRLVAIEILPSFLNNCHREERRGGGGGGEEGKMSRASASVGNEIFGDLNAAAAAAAAGGRES